MLRTLRAEQIKLTTLRSSWWSIALTMTASIGFAILLAAVIPSDDHSDDTVGNIGVLFLIAAQLAMILLMAMAVIVATSEYRFGQIRMTLAATPRRWQVWLAKAFVVMIVTFVVGAITAWVAVLVAKPLLPSGWRLVLSDPDATRIIWGLPMFFAVASLLAMSLGTILRNSPAAITILAVVPLGVEKVLLAIPKTSHFAQYLPFNAGQRITQPMTNDFILTPWAGFGFFCLYTLGLFVVALILAEVRDA